jgi:hypothetical protein
MDEISIALFCSYFFILFAILPSPTRYIKAKGKNLKKGGFLLYVDMRGNKRRIEVFTSLLVLCLMKGSNLKIKEEIT